MKWDSIMFDTLFRNLKADNSNEEGALRRKYTRRDCDQCVIKIDDKTYPVSDWSLGGFSINADGRNFGVKDAVNMVLKFKLSNRIIDVSHSAKVVRKTQNKVAFQFAPIPRDVRGKLQSVVDDHVTSQFANSQIA